MSGGFGLPVLNLQQALGRIGEAYEKGQKQAALGRLGEQLKLGDYGGAAATAFDAGDAGTGIGLLKLGEERSKLKLVERDSAAFEGLIGGLGQLGGSGGGLGPLGSGAAPRADASPRPGAVPTFAGGGSASMTMPGSGGEAETKFVSALKDGGLTNPYGLGAMAAYAGRESGFKGSNINGSWSDPSESGAPGTSGGILSWRGDRFANMRRLTAGAADPVVAQAKFALTENPDLTMALQSAKSPEEANQLMANAWKFAGYNRRGGEFDARLGSTRQYVAALGGASAAGSPRQIAGADSEADLPAEGVVPAGFQIPGDDPTGGSGARRLVRAQSQGSIGADQAPVAGQPSSGSLVAENAAGRPTVANDATIAGVPAATVAQTPLGSRIPALMRASALPHLPESQRQLAQTLLKQALDETKLPDAQKDYLLARGQGFRGTFLEYQRELKRPGGPTILSPGQTVYDEVTNTGRYTAPQKQEGQFIQSGGRVLFGDKATGTVGDVTPEGLPPTWRPLTAQERTALNVKDDAAVYMTPDGPKSVSGQTINVAGGERAQDAAIGADYGKRFVEMQRAAASSRSTLGTIDVMERAMNAPGFYSGTGGAARLAFNRGLESLNIKGKGEAAPAEVFGAFSNKLIIEGLGGSLGQGISNGDREFIQGTGADLAKTPAGNRQLLNIARQLATRQQEVAKLAREYAGRNNNRLDPGFDDALANWAEANPLFAPKPKRSDPSQREGQAPQRQGASQVDRSALEAEARRRGLIQ